MQANFEPIEPWSTYHFYPRVPKEPTLTKEQQLMRRRAILLRRKLVENSAIHHRAIGRLILAFPDPLYRNPEYAKRWAALDRNRRLRIALESLYHLPLL